MRSCLIALALIFLASCHTDQNTLSELVQKMMGEFQGQHTAATQPHQTNSWYRRDKKQEYDKKHYEGVTHSINHHRQYFRRHSCKTFFLPSGQTYSVKNLHASKSVPCRPGAKVVEIKNDKKHYKAEYNMVVNEFTKSNNEPTKKFQIKKVEKVLNGCWMQKYNYRQKQIKRDLADGESMNEKMIFHGTSNAHIVAQIGFDERFAKKELGFGAGIYFSDHSSKANEESTTNRHGLREVLLCRVTLGKKLALPMKGRAHAPVSFHSVVSGRRYVIYRGEQAYPDYIITYKEANRWITHQPANVPY